MLTFVGGFLLVGSGRDARKGRTGGGVTSAWKSDVFWGRECAKGTSRLPLVEA